MNADIIAIAAPSSVSAGEQVVVDVSVMNSSGSDQYIAVTALYNSTSFPFQPDYLLVSPGQTVIFRGSFAMPSEAVRVTAWSWHWDGSQWVNDDQITIDIALAALTPQISEFQILDFSKV
jgi:plastocyanin